MSKKLKRVVPKKKKRMPPTPYVARYPSYPFKPVTSLFRGNYAWQIAPLMRMNIKGRCTQLSTSYAAAFDPAQDHPFQNFYIAFVKEYLIELRLRYQFRRLLNAYRVHKANQKSTDFVDPVTLNPIREPIYVYSVKDRRRYIFEADSLNKSIRKNLYHSQYTIPEPKAPINLFTNRPFTDVQLMSIVEQLRATKQRIEDVSTYRTLQFQLPIWRRYMYRQLRMTAIKEELQNSKSLDGQDMLTDFIKDSMIITKFVITDRFEVILDSAVHWYPDHPLIGLLRTLCIKSYESELFKIDIHEVLMLQFASIFARNFPRCDLWSQVEDRLIADAQALREMEALDVEH